MNPPQFDAAVEDLRRRLPKSAVKAAIVFGSVAREEATEESDLDLLVIPRSERDEESILRVIREIEGERRVRIGTVFGSPSLRELDRQFLDAILREGRVILGSMPRVDVRELDLEPARLVSLDLRSLPHSQKVRLERELLGFRTRKLHKDRVYERSVPGGLAEWGGRKVGRGVLLVPEAAVAQLDRVLRKYGAKRLIVPVWIQRP